jgi:aspartate ammonia-lyase
VFYMSRSCVQHVTFLCATCHVLVCNMSRSCVQHVTFLCATCHALVCNMSRSCVQMSRSCVQMSRSCVQMSRSCVQHVTLLCATCHALVCKCHALVCNMSRSCVQHVTLLCATCHALAQNKPNSFREVVLRSQKKPLSEKLMNCILAVRSEMRMKFGRRRFAQLMFKDFGRLVERHHTSMPFAIPMAWCEPRDH